MAKPIKKADPTRVLESLTKAVMAGKSLRPAAADAGLSMANVKTLEAALGVDIDAFREKTLKKLMGMSEKMLNQIDDRMDEIPASSWGFHYSIFRDSITAMHNKTAPASANVNIQVNNYGSDAAAKAQIIDALMGNVSQGAVAQQPVAEAVIEVSPQPTDRAPDPQ